MLKVTRGAISLNEADGQPKGTLVNDSLLVGLGAILEDIRSIESAVAALRIFDVHRPGAGFTNQ
ncbi:hypothetical protein P775_25820 [Puniceibacterium antarcticum]|uniref:Uncharacterized protein n=1 Tax=Puniceibacterium antarcticum TaxID=1206336 RepID=A0A2G8R229_9RHOB|nr:hypothetical protein P775_25820 [Puniceibacterium antarcticum]